MLDRLFLFVVFAFSAAAAVAQDGGFYLGGALGQSKFKEWCDVPGADCKNTDTSWKVFGGYRFNRYVSAEGTYVDWGEVTLSTGSASVAASQTSYGLAVVGTLPLGDRFELFGKAGFLRTEQETTRRFPNPSTLNRNETGSHYGLGAKYLFTKNWALRGEWENTNKLNVDLISIGVEYRF